VRAARRSQCPQRRRSRQAGERRATHVLSDEHRGAPRCGLGCQKPVRRPAPGATREQSPQLETPSGCPQRGGRAEAAYTGSSRRGESVSSVERARRVRGAAWFKRRANKGMALKRGCCMAAVRHATLVAAGAGGGASHTQTTIHQLVPFDNAVQSAIAQVLPLRPSLSS